MYSVTQILLQLPKDYSVRLSPQTGTWELSAILRLRNGVMTYVDAPPNLGANSYRSYQRGQRISPLNTPTGIWTLGTEQVSCNAHPNSWVVGEEEDKKVARYAQ